MRAMLVTLSVLVLIAAFVLGCHQPQTRVCRSGPALTGDLLFNPFSLDGPNAHPGRAPWPVTQSDGLTWEDSHFTTTIRDMQTPWISNRDSYYRQFQSIRTGGRHR